MVSEHSHPLDSVFPYSTSNSELMDEMIAVLMKWRAEDKEIFIKCIAEDQERRLKVDSTLKMVYGSQKTQIGLQPAKSAITAIEDDENDSDPFPEIVENLVSQNQHEVPMVEDPDIDLNQETQDQYGFIVGEKKTAPLFANYEDPKLNCGFRYKRVMINNTYHKPRLKTHHKRLARRRLNLWFSSEVMVCIVGIGLSLKSVVMKKHVHNE